MASQAVDRRLSIQRAGPKLTIRKRNDALSTMRLLREGGCVRPAVALRRAAALTAVGRFVVGIAVAAFIAPEGDK